MKILLSISMSFLFLFQGISQDVDLCEPIQKISNFITHYQDHKIYGDSFFDYVVEDYVDNDAKNEGHHNNQDKENMPVHAHQQCCHPLVFIIEANSILLDRLKIEEGKQFNSYTFQLNSRYLESLFQPPRA
ncbi:hypothetical protein LX77_02048 [Gelidibacter algens]|uniref:Uncharacterized protein n=1 Tax=Gelidibacter algens TaxID=49280 RepID=A0A327S941_9FLAO|nr:hypothetical protein [Gelidibacter algens]RAJ24494.1 hypothetical protein LX77_02048 [Gelidibacter algens]